jgi:hypothetical protein
MLFTAATIFQSLMTSLSQHRFGQRTPKLEMGKRYSQDGGPGVANLNRYATAVLLRYHPRMRYEYDPETERITWLEDVESSPIEGISRAEYQRAVESIERARKMSVWEIIEENQRRIRRFSDLKQVP